MRCVPMPIAVKVVVGRRGRRQRDLRTGCRSLGRRVERLFCGRSDDTAIGGGICDTPFWQSSLGRKMNSRNRHKIRQEQSHAD